MELNEQLPLLPTQADAGSFDNFYLSEHASGNHEIIQLLKQFAEYETPTPFYIHGQGGSGKTHLLSAVMRLRKSTGESPLAFFDLRDDNVPVEMLSTINKHSFVCLDNIDAWATDKHAEAALFALVERAKQGQWPLLLTSENAPQQAGFLLADLVSRLASGVVYRLESMDDVAKFEAIKMRANQRGVSIGDESIRYLLTHVARDNHSLFAILAKLDEASLVAKRRLTLPFIQQFLAKGISS